MQDGVLTRKLLGANFFDSPYKYILNKYSNSTQLNSTHSLMRKDLTGHTGPNGHLHMPVIKLKKDKQNQHAKFMVTLPHGRQQHYLAVF